MVSKIKGDAIVNWKTTVAGITAFLAVVTPQVQTLFDSDTATNPDWNIVVGAVGVLFAALFARDADKSTEQTIGNTDG